MTAVATVVAAAALDRGFAEPSARVHPVALLDRLISPVDREWSRPTFADAVVTVALPALATGVTTAVAWVATLASSWFGAAVAALILSSTTSLRMPLDVAATIVSATADESDLDTARYEPRALVGCDPSSLSTADIRSAVVKSTTENFVDGLTAPLFAFMLFMTVSLPPAVGVATWVRDANTFDSMFGCRHKPVGRVPARLDDVVAWLPARVSAVLLAVVASASAMVARVGELARHPSSSNSG